METIKAVILKGGDEYDWVINHAGNASTAQVAQATLNQVAEKAEVPIKDIECISVTGTGRAFVSFVDRELSEPLCLAKGIAVLLPSTRILVDLGARKSLAVKCNDGRATKISTSDKCASGTGAFLEMLGPILKTDIHSIDELFFQSTRNLELQSTCAVFAESEIISLIHGGAEPADIIRGVFHGLASRIYPLLFELGLEKEIAVVGGVAGSRAMIAALEEMVGFKILVPENPQLVSALGAALIARGTRMGIS